MEVEAITTATLLIVITITISTAIYSASKASSFPGVLKFNNRIPWFSVSQLP